LLEKAAAEAKQNALRSLVAQQSTTNSQSRLNHILCPRATYQQQQQQQTHDTQTQLQTKQRQSAFYEQALLENRVFDIEQFLDSSDEDESENLSNSSNDCEKSTNSSETTTTTTTTKSLNTNWSYEDNNQQKQQVKRTSSYNLFGFSLDYDFHSAAFGGNGLTNGF
jgi:hypothetical protein